MNSDVFDLVIIGAGPGGYVAAIRAAQLGFKTALIEKDKSLGGTCLNVGCIPSKALLDSSEHYHYAKTKLQKHGVLVSDVKLDLDLMMKRKEAVVRQLTNGIAGLIKKNKIEHVMGKGRLGHVSGDVKEVVADTADGSKTLKTKRILIATGSTPVELPFLPFDGKKIVSSTEALCFPQVPKHLAVIGGGVIGLELGSVWARLGAKVTVVEFQDRILPTMDQQCGKELFKLLQKQGLEFKLFTKCLGAKKKGDFFTVELEDRNSAQKSTIECDFVLVATGRKPYTDGLGLDQAGIPQDKQGRVEINDHFETNIKGVYAVGDVVRGPMLAHKAEEDGIAAVEIMAGQAGHVDYNLVPGVVYTWPEFASVGQTEEQLKEKNLPYKVGSFPFIANGRAKAMDELEGLVKIIAHAQTDRVLGVHIVGPRASDLIPEAVAVMEYGGSAEDIARTCHAHPTLSEVVKEAALAVDKRQIHL